MKETIQIMHCFDNRYVIPAAVSLYSMLDKADKEYNYRISVIHDDIDKKNQERLQLIVSGFANAELIFSNMQDDRISRLYRKWGGYRFSKEMFYKLIAPEIFSDCNKMIISDVDVLWMDDISKIWKNFDITEGGKDEQYYLIGSEVYDTFKHGNSQERLDISQKESKEREYRLKCFQVGAGLYVFNIKKMLKDGIVDRFLEAAISYSSNLLWPEQDIINYVCYPQIKLFEKGVVSVNKVESNILQLHFASDEAKPWSNLFAVGADLWRDCLKKTVYWDDWLTNIQNAVNLYDSLQPVFQIKIPQRPRWASLLRTMIKAPRKTRVLNTMKDVRNDYLYSK